jgi:hypothetical protein
MSNPPTVKQIRAITRLCLLRGIKEPLEEKVSNTIEARNLIYRLRSMK